MGFSKKNPEYKACIQFIQAISPKHNTNIIDKVNDVTSPAEAHDGKMDNDVICCKNSKKIEDLENEQLTNEEEHGAIDDINDNDMGEQRGEI